LRWTAEEEGRKESVNKWDMELEEPKVGWRSERRRGADEGKERKHRIGQKKGEARPPTSQARSADVFCTS